MQGATQAGVDFGWSQTEGDVCRTKDDCDFDTITTPIHDYDHKNGDCAVVGGPVISTAAGRQVIFGDLCSGRIWSIAAGGESPAELQMEGELRISSFGQDNDGTGYVLVHWKNGRIYRLVADAAG